MLDNARRANPLLPWRMVWMAAAVIALSGAVAMVAVLLATAPSGGRAAVGPSGRQIAIASPACGRTDRAPVNSTRAGAHATVVPAGATSVLLCRYGPGGSPRVRERLITSSATISRLARELNALPPAKGAYACPNDDGEAIIADFSYASGTPDPVSVGLRGCGLVSNGHVHRISAGTPLGGQLAALVPWHRTIR